MSLSRGGAPHPEPASRGPCQAYDDLGPPKGLDERGLGVRCGGGHNSNWRRLNPLPAPRPPVRNLTVLLFAIAISALLAAPRDRGGVSVRVWASTSETAAVKTRWFSQTGISGCIWRCGESSTLAHISPRRKRRRTYLLLGRPRNTRKQALTHISVCALATAPRGRTIRRRRGRIAPRE